MAPIFVVFETPIYYDVKFYIRGSNLFIVIVILIEECQQHHC